MTNDFLPLITIVVIFLFLFEILLLIWITKNVKSGSEKNDYEKEFKTSISALNGVVEAHVQMIFDEEVSRLRSQFDLKVESQTNSKKQFIQAFDDLCNQTTKIIMKTYLSKSLLKTLLEYYTIEGLTLFVLSILRKR